MIRPSRFPQGKLKILMTDRRLPDPFPALRRLPPSSWVILRFMTSQGPPAYTESLAAECHRRRLKLLVSGDWRLASRLKADGLHLSEHVVKQGCLSPALGWLRGDPRRILTVSAHNRAALARGCGLGADAILLSPVFPTASHPQAKHLGLLSFRQLVHQAKDAPVIALGGIDFSNLGALASCKIAGLGGISLFTE